MSNEKAKPAGLKGLWDVSDLAGDPPVKPSAEQTAAARQVGERLGFVSREVPPSPAPVEKARTEFTARMSIRVRPTDKTLLEDLGWRLRTPMGEIITRALELFVAEQEVKEKGRGGE